MPVPHCITTPLRSQSADEQVPAAPIHQSTPCLARSECVVQISTSGRMRDTFIDRPRHEGPERQ